MTGQTLILSTRAARQRAHALVDAAPEGAVLNIRLATRSSAQNDRMWAMLGDVSRAKPEGRVLPPEIWKCVFMASVGHQCRFEPSLDGKGVVPIGFKSSRLNKGEFGELLDAIDAYGSQHGVEWTDPAIQKQAA